VIAVRCREHCIGANDNPTIGLLFSATDLTAVLVAVTPNPNFAVHHVGSGVDQRVNPPKLIRPNSAR
jgi:hypothetical protein